LLESREAEVAAEKPVVVIGAGVAGLAAAATLAGAGVPVRVLEAATAPGGKMRQVLVGGRPIDAGPTVLTWRDVFEDLFAAAGARLQDHLTLHRADILARHAWSEGERLDLHADLAGSADAIGRFAGAAEAQRFLRFAAEARRIHDVLEASYMRATRPNVLQLVQRVGLRGLPALARIRPFARLWGALGDHFRDPRLRQLYGRYSTYCGSSPFLAPATLMLIAHVEQQGVWFVDGGMHALARALQAVAEARGAQFRFGARVAEVLVAGGRTSGVRLVDGETIDARAVICNAELAAVADGLLGPAAARAVPRPQPALRSLSAVTWCTVARTRGFALERHNVFFSRDYVAEFAALDRARTLPPDPTVYLCAQDRPQADGAEAERLLLLINAPADGDRRPWTADDVQQAAERTRATLARCGLELEPQVQTASTPGDFVRLFPGNGGALYGSATHGWRSSLTRPGSRTRLPGFYMAGGSVHPGPGVPMAALSGGLAAAEVLGPRLRSHPSPPPQAREGRGGGGTGVGQ
jgi:1-hydroxycarotenoid 3,4-desaturase